LRASSQIARPTGPPSDSLSSVSDEGRAWAAVLCPRETSFTTVRGFVATGILATLLLDPLDPSLAEMTLAARTDFSGNVTAHVEIRLPAPTTS